MANIWEKVISILLGNLNSGLSYPITTVQIKASEPIVRFLSESKGSEH